MKLQLTRNHKGYMGFCFCLTIAILLLNTSCSNKKRDEEKRNIIKRDSLVSKLKIEHEKNVYEIREMSNQLLNIEDEEAQLFGNYYLLKADYYTHGDVYHLKRMLEFYPKFKDKKYEDYRLEIDIFALTKFIIEDDLKNASITIQRLLEYLFQPKYEKAAIRIIYSINSNYLDPESNLKNIKDIKAILKRHENEPWSKLHHVLYYNLGGYYYIKGQTNKAIEMLELVKTNDIESDLVGGVITVCNQLIWIQNDRNAIETAEEAIELAYKYGFLRSLPRIYMFKGLVHANLKEYQKAYECFTLANNNLSKNPHFIRDLEIDGYAAWTFFQINPKANLDSAVIRLDNLAEVARAKGKYSAAKMALERKQWAYESLGKKSLAKEAQKEVNRAKDNVKVNFENNESYLNDVILLKERENEFEKLNLNKEILKEKLYRQNLFIISSIVFLILGIVLIYQYRLNNYILDEIKDINDGIVDQNIKLKNVINSYKESNKYLENFGKIVAHDIRNPLFTITGYATHLNKKLRGFANSKHISQLDTIVEDCTKLSSYITDIQTLSKLTSNLEQKQKIDIFNQINDIYNYLKNNKDINYRMSFESTKLEVFTYENLLEELFQNILLLIGRFNEKSSSVKVSYNGKLDHLLFSDTEILEESLDDIYSTIEYKICTNILDFYGKCSIEFSENQIVIKSLFKQIPQ